MDLLYILNRTLNNMSGTFMVAYDKTYDIISESKNIKNINDDDIINVDGNDKRQIKKKMERLYPSNNFIKEYTHFLSDPTEVYKNVYLGSAYNAACWDTIEKYNIKYVINVTSEISNYFEHKGIEYYKISIKDNNNESIYNHLQSSYEIINNYLELEHGNVLIHCYMGASRSATIATYFISQKTNEDITTVIDDIIKKRPIINPTQQFVRDLISI
jgi:hypothetical protein